MHPLIIWWYHCALSLNYVSKIWETIRSQLIHGRYVEIISHEFNGMDAMEHIFR